jgi:GTP pyrophosphokinase
VTPRAKSKIRHWLTTEETARAIEIGKRAFEKELREYRLAMRKVLDGPAMKQYLESEGLGRLEDLYARLGFGKTSVRQVLEAVLPSEELAAPPEAPAKRLRKAVNRILPLRGGPIVVKGEGDLLTVRAKCCNPLPGEEIVGYITRGRGVSVHAIDCTNVKNLLYEPGRRIEVEWARDADSSFAVGLRLETEDQTGVIARLTEAIAALGSSIRQLEAVALETGKGIIEITVEVRDREQWDRLVRDLKRVPGVLRVDRRRSAERQAEGS